MMVAGLGSRSGGDDGVGLAVAEAVRAAGGPAVGLQDAAGLVELLDGRRLVLVDAVVDAGPPGAIVEIPPAAIRQASACSSHGIDVPTAIGLAEALNGPDAAAGLVVLGVCIATPDGPGVGLSPALQAAVPEAARKALELLDA